METYKASFNTQNATAHSSDHLNRKTKVSYLLDPNSQKNEYKNYNVNLETFKQKAQESYKVRTKQTMQKKQLESLIKEAVINVKKNTNINDIEKTFKNLHTEFGGYQLFEIAIHKDEGYFYHKKEKLEYRPNADIFYNEKDKQFYLDSKYKQKADLNEFEKRYNYHAHVIYSPFDLETGKGRTTKKDMQKVQTIVADSLDMQRGEFNSKAKRMNHWQLKQQADIKRAVKKELHTEHKAKQKDLKDAIKKQRDKLKEYKAKREHYKELEQLNRDLKQQIKNGITSNEMKEQIKGFEKKLINARETILEQKQEIVSLRDDNNDLEQNINDLKVKNKDIIIKAKDHNKEIQDFIKKHTMIDKHQINKHGLWKAFVNKINTMKNQIKDLFKSNEQLKKENEKLKKYTEQFKRYDNAFDKIEETLLTQEEQDIKLSLEEIVERIQDNQIKSPEIIKINTPIGDENISDKINEIPTNEDDTNTINQTKQTLNQIQTIANNAVSVMKGIQKMNDIKEIKKAAMQSAAGIAGIAQIIKMASDTAPGAEEKDNIRRYEHRPSR